VLQDAEEMETKRKGQFYFEEYSALLKTVRRNLNTLWKSFSPDSDSFEIDINKEVQDSLGAFLVQTKGFFKDFVEKT
jgi:hypothetical protein